MNTSQIYCVTDRERMSDPSAIYSALSDIKQKTLMKCDDKEPDDCN